MLQNLRNQQLQYDSLFRDEDEIAVNQIGPSPGKVTLTSNLQGNYSGTHSPQQSRNPTQLKEECGKNNVTSSTTTKNLRGFSDIELSEARAMGFAGRLPAPQNVNHLGLTEAKTCNREDSAKGLVQRRSGVDTEQCKTDVQSRAAEGVKGAGKTLPYMGKIQSAFGSHDISGIQSYQGGEAAVASKEIGARAYATGNKIAFGESPDLHTAAHEAAHVVQQRAGVSLEGGVGQTGDRYEQHADAVADLVVQGKSAEELLNRMVGGATKMQSNESSAVQCKGGTPTSASGGTLKRLESKEEKMVREMDLNMEAFVAKWAKEKISSGISKEEALTKLRPHNDQPRNGQLIRHGEVTAEDTAARKAGEKLDFDGNITLTFDDGPDILNGTTEAILNVFTKYRTREVDPVTIRATFFVHGERITGTTPSLNADEISQAKALLQRMKDEGHIVANHSWAHILDPSGKATGGPVTTPGADGGPGTTTDTFPPHSTSGDLLKMTQDALTPYQSLMVPKYVRLPGGAGNLQTLKNLEGENHASVGWDINSYDYGNWNAKECNGISSSEDKNSPYIKKMLRKDSTSAEGIVDPLEEGSCEADFIEVIMEQIRKKNGGDVLLHDGHHERARKRGDVKNEGRQFTARMLEHLIEAILAERKKNTADSSTVPDGGETSERAFRFTGLDDVEAFGATNAYAKVIDPTPFARQEIRTYLDTEVRSRLMKLRSGIANLKSMSHENQSSLLAFEKAVINFENTTKAVLAIPLKEWDSIKSFVTKSLAAFDANWDVYKVSG